MGFARTEGLVSVVVTNYNKGPYLTDCLDSLFNQTYRNWEMIVVDDASTDDSADKVKAWIDRKMRHHHEAGGITLLSLPRNIGYAGAVTTGMFLARGEFIAVQDADDLSHPERLRLQVEYLRRHSAIELLGTNYGIFEVQPGDRTDRPQWLRYGEEIRTVYASGGHCICHGTIMLRGSLFDRIGGQNRKVRGAEDYEFIARCLNAKVRNVENMKEVLYYYRFHPGQRSRKYFGKGRADEGGT